MFLSRIVLDARSREARRDLANAYEMHRTLCRGFQDGTPASFLWRLEPDRMTERNVIVQSGSAPDWAGLPSNYALQADSKMLSLTGWMTNGAALRFRLRANPTVTRNRKRLGLRSEPEQREWLGRQGQRLGFAVLGATLSGQQRMALRKGENGVPITLDAVLFDGILTVLDAELFGNAVRKGLGHGKAMGLGLLSCAPHRGPAS